MPTRYNTNSKSRFGIGALPSGYGSPGGSTFELPPVGIEDVDRALFNLFENEINFVTTTKNDGTKKVPVIFAAGEKWAMLKRGRALRDKQGTLILPLITIIRNNIAQSSSEDIAGRGINQQQGELVIKRRLSETDRSYQSLVNRLLLKNQANLAQKTGTASLDDQPLVTREIGDLADDGVTQDGGLLRSDLKNNVFEFIVIPTPQFFTANYEIIIWAQYQQQMNEIIESLLSSFLPQGNAWRLDTPKGYWFVATVDGNTYNAQNNFDDMSSEERLVKYQFSIKVPGYVLASRVPGAPVPIRRYLSSAEVQFSIAVNDETTDAKNAVDDPFLGSDDPTLPLARDTVRRRDQRDDMTTKLYPNSPGAVTSEDPALRGRAPARYKKVQAVDSKGNTVERYVRVRSINKHTGEMIFAPSTNLGGLTIVSVED